MYIYIGLEQEAIWHLNVSVLLQELKKKKKEALQVHLWKTNRLTNTASQGPFPLFHMPEAPSHTVNQEACVSLTVCLARTNMEHP